MSMFASTLNKTQLATAREVLAANPFDPMVGLVIWHTGDLATATAEEAITNTDIAYPLEDLVGLL
ncbi:hypothetical protein ACWF99_23665 [Nocardia sp. NPDC055002]